MDAFGPYGSANYDATRRRRRWAANQGMQGYAAFLMGDASSQLPADIIGAETAALSYDGSLLEHPILRPVMIGVLTGACTFIVNRWLGKVFK